ncbi:MAG: hypothetical protein VYD04_00405, partial [Pseudomonadota bacterium]|nr:hypothetical protein [Pseudomonadota bacterium]
TGHRQSKINTNPKGRTREYSIQFGANIGDRRVVESYERDCQQHPVLSTEDTAKPGGLEPHGVKPGFFYQRHVADTA